jgi:hypothetical protein
MSAKSLYKHQIQLIQPGKKPYANEGSVESHSQGTALYLYYANSAIKPYEYVVTIAPFLPSLLLPQMSLRGLAQ